MNTIWKFTPDRAQNQHGRFVLPAPLGAKPLSVGVQDGELVVWALVDTDAAPGALVVWVAGTGEGLPPRLEPLLALAALGKVFGASGEVPFLGTVQQGPFAWHVWAVGADTGALSR